MLKTIDLTYRYPQSESLVFPDLAVRGGEALLICGESGCGKTTLLHLLAGLRKPTSGQILIDETDISGFSFAQMDQFRGKHIGIVYQESYFIESMSVIDNLIISPYAAGKSQATEIAKRLNIDAFLHRRPNQLSTGQQQRASIARAVMNQPKIILADEPTSNLDNKNCAEVINLLMEASRNNNAALIVVTHDDRLRSDISNCIDLEIATNKVQ